MKKFLLVLFLLPFLTMGAVSPPGERFTSEDGDPSDQETLPITVDFHCPINFGFHIGDKIPLTVTLEAQKGVILDLVNLPRKNDTHGPFEVREMSVSERRENGRTA